MGFLKLRIHEVTGYDERFISGGGHFKHRIDHHGLHNRTESAGSELILDRLIHDSVESRILEYQFHPIGLEQFFILTGDGIFRFGQDSAQRIPVKRLETGKDRQTPYDLGNQSETLEVAGHHKTHQILALLLTAFFIMAVSHHMCVEPGGNLTLYTVESTPADKEDILCVHRNHFLLRMFPSAVRRNEHHTAFEEFEKPLLHPFATDIAGD